MISQSQKKWTFLILLILVIGGFVLVKNRTDQGVKEPETKDFRRPPVSSAPSSELNLKEKMYMDLLKDNPDNAELHARLGDLYFDNKRFEKAIAEYRRAIKIEPADVDSYNDLGLALHYTGRSGKAIDILKKGTGVNASYQRVWLSYGFVLASVGNNVEARNALNKVISLDPNTTIGIEAKRILGLLK